MAQSKPSLRRYEKLEKLGVGAYGTVYKIRDIDTGEFLALKKVRIYENEESLSVNVIREAALLKSISHPNVIRLLQVQIDRPKKKALFYFELMEENLKSIIDSTALTYGFLKSLAKQMLEGLYFLHHRQIIHRDIKPLNLLVNRAEGVLKIADFGLAKPVQLPHANLTVEVQTLWYKAPELLLGDDNYDVAIDCWASGCVIAEMILGKPLFNETSEVAQLFRIFEILGSPPEGHYLTSLPLFKRSFPKFRQNKLRQMFPNCEKGLVDLLEGLLTLSPKTRLSAADAIKAGYMQ